MPTDSRDFTDAGRVLAYFCEAAPRIRLLGNNPMKRRDLEKVGVTVSAQEALVIGITPFNVRYLSSKREHGHAIPAGALEATRSEPPPKS